MVTRPGLDLPAGEVGAVVGEDQFEIAPGFESLTRWARGWA